MKERVIKIRPSTRKGKKYMATMEDGRTIHFGASDYEQYKDSTGIGKYSSKNHGDSQRRQRYFSRHSGEQFKGRAIEKEFKKSNGKYTAKILSHIYLW
jgi:hypothetical protein